jgi:deoxycytidylate deaminase
MIVNAGIEEIFYEDGYDDSLAGEILKEAGVRLVRVTP